MKIVFRCDASLQMGTGHVMRCLTLANELALGGAECHFICREHLGHLLDMIKQRGHQAYSLAVERELQSQDEDEPVLAHAGWLGATQQRDAARCKLILEALQPDWLIVDHYSLDQRWEKVLRPYCQKIMVIDDLADRQHDCEILLDQTFGRESEDYVQWVPKHCQLLCGSTYALLRPEFAQWREYSLKRRKYGQLQHLLINLGGVDKDNITTQILKAIQNSALPNDCKITVVMGSTAPWVEVVQQQAVLMPWPTEVKVGVSNMAELMANSDLAIGAAGSTSWERCCLGLPTIMLVLADNQRAIAQALQNVGAAFLFDFNILSAQSLSFESYLSSKILEKMSISASSVLNGLGALRVIETLTGRV